MKKVVKLSNLTHCLILLFLSGIISSCANVPFYNPLNTSGSENLGAGNSLNLTYNQGNKMEFAEDLNASSVTANQKFVSESAVSFHYRKSVIPAFDFETTLGSNIPLYLGGKLQLYGEAQDSAKGGSISVALRGGLSAFVTNGTAEVSSTGEERDFSINGWRFPGELLVGYRHFDWHLIYTSFGYGAYNYSLSWDDDSFENIKFSGKHTFISIGNSFNFSGFSVLVGLSFDKITIDENEAEELSDTLFNVTLGYNF